MFLFWKCLSNSLLLTVPPYPRIVHPICSNCCFQKGRAEFILKGFARWAVYIDRSSLQVPLISSQPAIVSIRRFNVVWGSCFRVTQAAADEQLWAPPHSVTCRSQAWESCQTVCLISIFESPLGILHSQILNPKPYFVPSYSNLYRLFHKKA